MQLAVLVDGSMEQWKGGRAPEEIMAVVVRLLQIFGKSARDHSPMDQAVDRRLLWSGAVFSATRSDGAMRPSSGSMAPLVELDGASLDALSAAITAAHVSEHRAGESRHLAEACTLALDQLATREAFERESGHVILIAPALIGADANARKKLDDLVKRAQRKGVRLHWINSGASRLQSSEQCDRAASAAQAIEKGSGGVVPIDWLLLDERNPLPLRLVIESRLRLCEAQQLSQRMQAPEPCPISSQVPVALAAPSGDVPLGSVDALHLGTGDRLVRALRIVALASADGVASQLLARSEAGLARSETDLILLSARVHCSAASVGAHLGAPASSSQGSEARALASLAWPHLLHELARHAQAAIVQVELRPTLPQPSSRAQARAHSTRSQLREPLEERAEEHAALASSSSHAHMLLLPLTPTCATLHALDLERCSARATDGAATEEGGCSFPADDLALLAQPSPLSRAASREPELPPGAEGGSHAAASAGSALLSALQRVAARDGERSVDASPGTSQRVLELVSAAHDTRELVSRLGGVASGLLLRADWPGLQPDSLAAARPDASAERKLALRLPSVLQPIAMAEAISELGAPGRSGSCPPTPALAPMAAEGGRGASGDDDVAALRARVLCLVDAAQRARATSAAAPEARLLVPAPLLALGGPGLWQPQQQPQHANVGSPEAARDLHACLACFRVGCEALLQSAGWAKMLDALVGSLVPAALESLALLPPRPGPATPESLGAGSRCRAGEPGPQPDARPLPLAGSPAPAASVLRGTAPQTRSRSGRSPPAQSSGAGLSPARSSDAAREDALGKQPSFALVLKASTPPSASRSRGRVSPARGAPDGQRGAEQPGGRAPASPAVRLLALSKARTPGRARTPSRQSDEPLGARGALCCLEEHVRDSLLRGPEELYRQLHLRRPCGDGAETLRARAAGEQPSATETAARQRREYQVQVALRLEMAAARARSGAAAAVVRAKKGGRASGSELPKQEHKAVEAMLAHLANGEDESSDDDFAGFARALSRLYAPSLPRFAEWVLEHFSLRSAGAAQPRERAGGDAMAMVPYGLAAAPPPAESGAQAGSGEAARPTERGAGAFAEGAAPGRGGGALRRPPVAAGARSYPYPARKSVQSRPTPERQRRILEQMQRPARLVSHAHIVQHSQREQWKRTKAAKVRALGRRAGQLVPYQAGRKLPAAQGAHSSRKRTHPRPMPPGGSGLVQVSKRAKGMDNGSLSEAPAVGAGVVRTLVAQTPAPPSRLAGEQLGTTVGKCRVRSLLESFSPPVGSL